MTTVAMISVIRPTPASYHAGSSLQGLVLPFQEHCTPCVCQGHVLLISPAECERISGQFGLRLDRYNGWSKTGLTLVGKDILGLAFNQCSITTVGVGRPCNVVAGRHDFSGFDR